MIGTNKPNNYFLGLILLFISSFYSEVISQEKHFEIFGYGQLDFNASTKSGSISGFNQKRLNLIEDFLLDKNIRVLSDVEFEGGTDITPSDPSSFGTVKISRAWLEYTFLPQLKIRGGKMLTPFGLYNLIHDAAASYFPVDPPIMYSDLKLFLNVQPQRLFSKYYVGLELLGTFELDNEGSQMEYSIGLGNGRGLNIDGNDLNNNRSISARIMYRPSFSQGLQIGASFYSDRNYNGIAGVVNDLENAYGLDLQFENSSFYFQVEGLASSYHLPDGNQITTGIGYAQLAYTLFDKLTPFVNCTKVLPNTKITNSTFSRFNLGLNYMVSPNLYLKSEIQFHETSEDLADETFTVIKFSVAFAF